MRRTGARIESLRRYAALLRGVSPLNAKMPELHAAFETAGFVDVKTVLSSGNVLFSAPAGKAESLARQCEAAMAAHLGRSFWTVVVSVAELRALVAADPWHAFKVPPAAKQVVSFLRAPPGGTAAFSDRKGRCHHLRSRRSDGFLGLSPSPQGPGVHDAHPEDVRRKRHHPNVGYREAPGGLVPHNTGGHG